MTPETSNMPTSVLVIEDYADLRLMIAATLGRRHVACDQVTSAEDAIAKLRERHYGAILLSPRASATDDPVMHFLHEQQPDELRKVILMKEPEHVNEGQDNEECAVLFKPFNRAELFEQIDRTLVR
jgi:DNA-binding NtrC family response regulator